MSQMTVINFGSARSVAITFLVDNQADLLLESTDTVKRYTDKPLLAEHGFSAMIDLNQGETCILWDAGVSQITLLENARRMQIDLSTISRIALSHGHSDHTTSLSEVLKAMDVKAKPKEWAIDSPVEELQQWSAGRRVPVIVHPAAFRERWEVRKDGSKVGPFLPPAWEEWQALGAEIIRSEAPYQLGPGCWTTGYIPRLSFEQSGRSPGRTVYRDGNVLLPDDIEDDQAIVINLVEKGLIVLSGCAHSGIVNTINYARQFSGVEQVLAVLGGFHLARATDDEIERTVGGLKNLDPALVSPSHCTGFKATAALASQMPGSFVQASVGTTYLF
jgi:7,8-dihydropterin-6-yl-methyl-4-(beta-D-ribofuranosyl)aminobenzene 5'-phosphate synthase